MKKSFWCYLCYATGRIEQRVIEKLWYGSEVVFVDTLATGMNMYLSRLVTR